MLLPESPYPATPSTVTSISYTRIHRLDLGAQLLHLRAMKLPGAVGQLRNGLLTFEYVAQPTPISREYSLRLTYRRGNPPEVRVLLPSIPELADGHGPVPHLYERSHPVRLCLYLPRTREWGPEMSLAQTVIPWSVDWLFYFEIWLATGEWNGGGEHPSLEPVETNQKRNRKKTNAE